ncbi:hypothetical protein NA57DRAFT_63943 [Rhizodiscina lignyota]|uniref:DUF3533 domain-containing protein n=1 Tax=Rhizodiscina lignyota TaxID=1504668 RepID=A0A9P4IQ93_9PEZI|nr:hypothetical protein NA57DRAFT_63943 [Rhizodiscina lignyota]
MSTDPVGAEPRQFQDDEETLRTRKSSDVQKGDLDAGVDQDEENQHSAPRPVGFWDPKLKNARKGAFSKWILTTVVLMIFILSVLSIYWAVFFHLPKNIQSLVVYIVDFDGLAPYDTTGHPPLVGPAIVQLANQMRQQTGPPTSTLGYGALPPSHFNNDPIQLVYQYSRDDTNFYDFILPSLSQLMTQATSMVGEKWARTVFANASDPAVVRGIQAAPQAISPAIGFSQYNLRPFYPYTAIPAVSIGLIYLIIISFFSFSFYFPIHAKYIKPEGHPPLHFWQLIVWRWIATIVAYFFHSLAYSFISLAFQINFGSNPVSSTTEPTIATAGNPGAYGNATFLVYWMLNFWGMIALGLACENMAMLVGMPWTGLWLIFWVITNVSTSFYDIDIEPGFYSWGYAFPLHQVVEGSRQILFDLHSRIGLNFGILIAWGAVNTALFPFMCYWMRYKTKHGMHEYWA